MTEYALHIAGQVTPSQSNAKIDRYHPATGDLVARYAAGNPADIAYAVAAARAAFPVWSETSHARRSALLNAAADALTAREARLAQIESIETGKPLPDALANIREGIALWRYAAASLRSQHGELHTALGDGSPGELIGCTMLAPVGIVGLITPWNFPFIVTAERLPFMLAAGCCVVMKPSEFAGGTAFATAEVLAECGFPPGVLNVVSGEGAEAGAALVSHPHVAMISFTGSSENGRRVMAACAATLKRVSLELGGKSPVVVFDDADFAAAAEAVIDGFTANAGQCCIATSRLLVEASAAARFEDALVSALRARFGDTPQAPQAIATPPQFHRVCQMLEVGREQGRTLYGGETGPAQFVTPTVFTDLPEDSSLIREEIFGPILTMQVFKDEADAIAKANATAYGLAAAIWTQDAKRARRMIRAIRAGRIWVNTKQENFPELPVGGFGASGIGREAGSSGIRAYSEIKTIVMR